jgi:hypothetical protein
MSDETVHIEEPKGLDRLFDSVIVRVIVSVGTFLTAAVLLAFKDLITSTWPLGGHPWPGFGGQIVWVPAVYWIGSLLLLLMGICQLVAGFRKDKRTERNRKTESAGLKGDIVELKRQNAQAETKIDGLNNQLDQVKQSVETLPGGGDFREQFAHRADELHLTTTTALLEAPSSAELANGIQRLLTAMAQLAFSYGPSDGKRHSAYVMKVVSPSGPIEQNLLAMVPEGVQNRQYQTLLLVEPDLNATMDGAKDNSVQPFALGVSGPAQPGNEVSVVPGAQLVSGGTDIIGVPDIGDQNELGMTLVPNALTAFSDFCSTHPWAFGKSFISLPLAVPSGATARDTIGVVTITSDGPKIMGGSEDRWKIFWMVMRPYTDGVATLLKLFLETRDEEAS